MRHLTEHNGVTFEYDGDYWSEQASHNVVDFMTYIANPSEAGKNVCISLTFYFGLEDREDADLLITEESYPTGRVLLGFKQRMPRREALTFLRNNPQR